MAEALSGSFHDGFAARPAVNSALNGMVHGVFFMCLACNLRADGVK